MFSFGLAILLKGVQWLTPLLTGHFVPSISIHGCTPSVLYALCGLEILDNAFNVCHSRGMFANAAARSLNNSVLAAVVVFTTCLTDLVAFKVPEARCALVFAET